MAPRVAVGIDPEGPLRPFLRAGFLLGVVGIPLLAGAGPVHAIAGERLRFGVEGGAALPITPNDFSSGWGAAGGFGVTALWPLTPVSSLLLRVERDRFPFEGKGLPSPPPGSAWSGTPARLTAISIGFRGRQTTGRLRAHATVYYGLVRRQGFRARATFPSPTGVWEPGERDATVDSFGFGVGLALVSARWPDLVAEGRVVWLGTGPSYAPLRVGLELP